MSDKEFYSLLKSYISHTKWSLPKPSGVAEELPPAGNYCHGALYKLAIELEQEIKERQK